jgi:hypothetical protein
VLRVEDVLSNILNSINETLATAIVVLTASMLLYNLSRNLRNRVARTSASVLFCVTIVSMCDVLISLHPSSQVLEIVVRLQWIGIAFIPASTFHLSDALLATTGLPSRGRRRRVSRLLYAISAAFVSAVFFTNLLIVPVIRVNTLINIVAGPMFLLYLLYFVSLGIVSFITVQRAKQRCLTRDTRRRMTYLQYAMFTPAFGIFPYSVLLGLSETSSVGMLFLVNLANFVLILMLLFLSYPISFFGSSKPDRLVKTDLLKFVLRGPATGLLALAVITFTTSATRILGFTGDVFMPFAVVTIILLWQWAIALGIPWLQRKLIYNSGEDDDQLEWLENLSDRLLTRTDLLQLLDANLATTCDYLQVNTAFVAKLGEPHPELIASIGPARPNSTVLEADAENLVTLLQDSSPEKPHELYTWGTYWISPLFSTRMTDEHGTPTMIGFMGIQARGDASDFTLDDEQLWHTQLLRAAETVDDLELQSEIYGSLEGLLPQLQLTPERAEDRAYKPGRTTSAQVTTQNAEDKEQFIEQVRAALRHYWGGPGLSGSRLIELRIVRKELEGNGNNPSKALRSILQKAIERQKPSGDRKLTSPEWTVYNIVQERFVERHKVREVAHRMALSEPDFYRKQKVAIEAIASTLLDMEDHDH